MAGTEVYDKVGNSYGYPYAIGQYIPWLNGGVIFELSSSNGENGKMISLTEPEEERLQWCLNTTVEVKAYDSENGANNMKKIKAFTDWQPYFPAFAWCYKYGTDWYLPAFYELIAIIDNQSAINSTLSAKGYATLDDGSGGKGYTGWWPYWTSTLYDNQKAHSLSMNFVQDDYIWNSPRSTRTNVMKVRAIFAW